MEERNRICSYRKCDNDITEKKKEAKFCCRNCKNMEKTYIKRKEKLIEKYKQIELKKVEDYKLLMSIVNI